MKKILLFLILLMPFVIFAQSESNKEGIKIAFDSEINRCRIIATTGKAIVPEDVFDGQPLSVYLMLNHSRQGNKYSIRFSMHHADGDNTLLFLTAPQPIILTLNTGQVMKFTSGNDFGWTELGHESYGKQHVLYSYSRDLGFSVTREQINQIIQGRIINVKFSLDGKKSLNYDIKDDLFSKVLNQQLQAIDDQMKKPVPINYSVPLKTTH